MPSRAESLRYRGTQLEAETKQEVLLFVCFHLFVLPEAKTLREQVPPARFKATFLLASLCLYSSRRCRCCATDVFPNIVVMVADGLHSEEAWPPGGFRLLPSAVT